MEEKEGIPPTQQRLIYSGKAMSVVCLPSPMMDMTSPDKWLCSGSVFPWPSSILLCRIDTNTLKSYGIQSGNVIHLVLAVRRVV